MKVLVVEGVAAVGLESVGTWLCDECWEMLGTLSYPGEQPLGLERRPRALDVLNLHSGIFAVAVS